MKVAVNLVDKKIQGSMLDIISDGFYDARKEGNEADLIVLDADQYRRFLIDAQNTLGYMTLFSNGFNKMVVTYLGVPVLPDYYLESKRCFHCKEESLNSIYWHGNIRGYCQNHEKLVKSICVLESCE